MGMGGRQVATRFSEADFRRLVDEARTRHNLSDIIARHTNLKRRGQRELVGLCPFHKEKTPSFEVNDLKGTYNCHGCGAGGDAITFLIAREGMTFREAIETLSGDSFPVISPEERAKRKTESERELAARIELGRSIWARTAPALGTPAEVYARSRGLVAPLPPTVRYVETPRWRDPQTGEVGRDHPAMACALQDVTGRVVGVQCVFLQDGGRRKYERTRDDGSKAKAKLTFGVVVGSALRLGPVANWITLTEGPEDGLTLRQEMPERSVWVACGTALLPRVNIPAGIEQITLAGDNNDAGRAAVAAAAAAYLDQGFAISEWFPDPRFKDWNEQLTGGAAA